MSPLSLELLEEPTTFDVYRCVRILILEYLYFDCCITFKGGLRLHSRGPCVSS